MYYRRIRSFSYLEAEMTSDSSLNTKNSKSSELFGLFYFINDLKIVELIRIKKHVFNCTYTLIYLSV